MMALLRSLSTLKLSGRGRKFGLFFVSSIGSRAVGIACQLLQVPIALKAMGTEAFGLWVTLSSLTYLLNFADLGVGVGVQNKLAEAFSLGRQREARTLFNSAFAFLLMIGLGLALILVPGSLLISAEHAFGLKNAQVVTEAPGALVAMLLWFCVNLPIGLAQRLAYGLQKGWMHNVSQAAGSALSLAGLAIAAHFRVSLGWMLAAAVFPSVLTSLGLLGLLLRQLHWLTLRGFEFRLEPLRGLLRLGFLFSVQQVSATVLFALPALVISNTLGAAAVTPYNLTQRLFNLFGVIQNAFMLPLWPAYAEANARGEMGWIRKTLNRSLLATFFLSILPMAVGTLLAPAILRIWVGKATDTVMPSHALLWLLFGWNALIFLQQPFGYLLAGVSEVKRLTVYSLLTVLLTVPLMLFMVGPWHQEGVIFALIAASLPFNLMGSVVETVRFLRGRSGSPGPVPAPEKPPSHDNTEDSSLTAIICTYNNAKCLGQTLAHLAQQSGGGHLIPVIVVDNNSTDETAAVVRSFQSRLPNLRYTVEQRQGTGHARQRGIAECTTGWLAFIDDDNYVAPGWAGAALEFIAAHPGCGVFGGKVTILWEQPPERLVRESGYAYAELDLGSNPQLLTGHMRWLVPGAGMVIRRRALIQSEWTQWTFCAGRAKQGVGVAGDDTEIVARVAREGWEIWYNPACQLNHFIVARRISNGYLAKLHFGFGTAEPVLRGLTRSDTFGMWFVRMLARLFVLAWFVLREVPLTPFGSYRRARLLVWFSYFRGAIAGLRAPFDFTPGERRRWLGHPASSLNKPQPPNAHESKIPGCRDSIRQAHAGEARRALNVHFTAMITPAPKISVILCTHDPREDYLTSTLEALRRQTLPLDEWEFLLVDNLSTPPLSGRVNLGWHPGGRHLREENIGLSNARICGLRAARADLILFVDDDNLLAPDYLANALRIAAEWPNLGVWGCHIEGRFEADPPAWVRNFAYHLAVRECERPIWASYVDDRNVPYGAGMCVRSAVGRAYVAKSETDALCTKLDRIGKGVGAAGDHDICHTAQDLGLGIGRFPSLRMTHLIPADRMQPDYFVRLVRGNSRAALLLALARKSAASYRTTRFWPLVKILRSRLFKRGMESRILCAQAQGELDALREIRRLHLAGAT